VAGEARERCVSGQPSRVLDVLSGCMAQSLSHMSDGYGMGVEGGSAGVSRLVDMHRYRQDFADNRFRNHGTFVVSGGTGHLGSILGSWLATESRKVPCNEREKQSCPSIVLLSRSGHGVPERLHFAMKDCCSAISITRCDVGLAEEAAHVLGRASSSLARSPLGSFIHSAGTLADATIPSQTARGVRRVMASKVAALRSWGESGLSLGCHPSPSSHVVFSSVASLLGAPGQANYSAANAMLETWSIRRQQEGSATTAVQWGAWAGEGMALESTVRRVEKMGMSVIDESTGVGVLESVLLGPSAASTPVVSAVPFRWSRVPASLVEQSRVLSLKAAETSPMSTAVTEPEVNEASGVVRAPQKVGTRMDHERIQSIVHGELESVLGASVEPDQGLMQAGLDSLGAVELRNALEGRLGVELSPTLVFDYPTPSALSAHLAELMGNSLDDGERSTGPVIRGPAGSTALASRPSQMLLELEAIAGYTPHNALRLHAPPDAVSTIALDRWDVELQPGSGPLSVPPRFAAMLNIDVAQFDAQIYGIGSQEGMFLDPQHRMLLNVMSAAVMQRGENGGDLSDYGVYVGISSTDYSTILDRAGAGLSAYSAVGNALSPSAGRLSFTFSLRGPAVAVDTACSSSLVGLHMGYESILRGRCSGEVAAGINLILAPDITSMFARSGMLSVEGRCKTLDGAADGYVRSEVCGVALLRGVSSDAPTCSTALGLVRGSAINQDGRSSSLTAPNGPSQQAVLRETALSAGIAPWLVSGERCADARYGYVSR